MAAVAEAPPAQARTSPSAADVSMRPLEFRSTHPPVSGTPILMIDEWLMLATQALPFESTAMREGYGVAAGSGVDRYSPITRPVSGSSLMTVPFWEFAIQT